MRSDLRPGTAPSDRYPPAVGSSAADGELREVVGVPLELLLQAVAEQLHRIVPAGRRGRQAVAAQCGQSR